MDEYNYWVTLYSIIFSVLIASLSLNSITLIKDKFNKILAFFVFTGLYSFILSYFFGKAFIGYTQQERLYKFIFDGYRHHLFHGNIYLILTCILFFILIIRLLRKRRVAACSWVHLIDDGSPSKLLKTSHLWEHAHRLDTFSTEKSRIDNCF